ncbi:MAG: hypothetical protein LBR93_00905, partial [Treponema sp.]|nr:hypothetical protein [Treponema sp.]
AALAADAEGVGLFRTEFLYLGRDACPEEEEQFEVYRDVAEMMGRRKPRRPAKPFSPQTSDPRSPVKFRLGPL